MSATRTLDALDRLLADLDHDAETVAASRADAIRAHQHRAHVTCNPQSFDAHVAGTDEFDGTPIFGACSTECAYA